MLQDKYPWVELIENEENMGFASANNQAFDRYDDTDYFLLLNNDIEVIEEEWLTTFVTFSEAERADITGCKLLYPDGSLQHGGGVFRPGWPPVRQVKKSTKDQLPYDGTTVWSPDYVTGAAFLVRSDVVANLNGFDERFAPIYYEETDFCARAARRGYTIKYTPDVELVHHESASTDSLPIFWFHNQSLFVLLHFPLHWLLVQFGFELRGLAGHIYNRRSLLAVYGPVLSRIPSIVSQRLTR
jgi:GT2 family glycosyltransferase